MTPDELIERYSRGQRDFPWVSLVGQQFDGMQLPDLVLTRAKLAGSRWNGAQLDRLKGMKLDASNGQFVGASLSGAVLGKAVFSGADLRQANLSGANLAGAMLANAQLAGADLTGATLDRADLRGADLRGAVWNETRAISALYDDATITPDGSDWPTWQQANPDPVESELEPEAELVSQLQAELLEAKTPEEVRHILTNPKRTLIPRVLSLQEYTPDVIAFASRDLRRRSLWDNLSRRLIALQAGGYLALGAICGAYGLPLVLMAIVAISIVGWHWDRQFTLVAPLLAIVITIGMLVPLASLALVGLVLGIVMLVLTLNFVLRYGLLEGLRNALWIACLAVLFLLGFNGLIGILGGLINVWVGLLTIASGAAVLAGSSMWIDLAQRGYSEQQAVKLCAIMGSGSFAVAWGLGSLLFKV